MWCASCRADVAAELSVDNRRMLCARCQTELGVAAGAPPSIGATPRTLETERDARDLLARWSAQNLLDVPLPSVGAGSYARPVEPTDAPLRKPDHRFDRSTSAVPAPSASFMGAMRDKQNEPSVLPLDRLETAEPDRDARIPRDRSRNLRMDDVAGREIYSINPLVPSKPASKPVDDQNAAIPQHQTVNERHPAVHRFRWSTLLGQLCAYAGVGLLTCGTILVMWSYFGGNPSYMPTGWLAAAIGQMLLLLGVVTLISSGMEQTVAEVAWRIDHLAEEIHHMGLAFDDLESEHRTARAERSHRQRHVDDQGSSREAA